MPYVNFEDYFKIRNVEIHWDNCYLCALIFLCLKIISGFQSQYRFLPCTCITRYLFMTNTGFTSGASFGFSIKNWSENCPLPPSSYRVFLSDLELAETTFLTWRSFFNCVELSICFCRKKKAEHVKELIKWFKRMLYLLHTSKQLLEYGKTLRKSRGNF